MRELEVKLEVTPAFRVPALDDLGDGVAAEQREVRRLDTVYLDTADLRLARWGATLRHRSGEGWTVKLPSTSSGSDGTLERVELTFPGDRRTPPDVAVGLVRALTRGAELETVLRLRTRRRPVVVTVDGTDVVEVVDDEVSVLDGRRIAARFREVEVELLDPEQEPLQQLVVERLVSAGAGRDEGVPKHVRALGPPATQEPDVVVPELGERPLASDVLRRAIATSVVRLVEHDAGVRIGEDPEAVHQMRVATRRLRSELRTYRPVLDPDWVTSLRDELRWLGGALGGVRDADVLRSRMEPAIEELPEELRPSGTRLLARLHDDREQARSSLLEALHSERFDRLLDAVVEAARAPRFLDGADGPADQVLPELTAHPWKRLDEAVGALHRHPPDQDLHETRILVKRARYAAEAVAPAVGRPADRFAGAAAQLQDVLGSHQDAVVAVAWLHHVATSSRVPGETAFVAGWLAARERARADQHREEWRKAWKQARKRRPETW